MNQKPSERIREVAGMSQEQLEYNQDLVSKAIIQYLDEEWEKQRVNNNPPYTEPMAQKTSHTNHCCVCTRVCGHTTPTSYCSFHRPYSSFSTV